MTVEPNRAPDGNGQPNPAAPDVESSDSLGSALPPTLFKLPNLNPGMRKPRPALSVPVDSVESPPASTSETPKEPVSEPAEPTHVNVPQATLGGTTAQAPERTPLPQKSTPDSLPATAGQDLTSQESSPAAIPLATINPTTSTQSVIPPSDPGPVLPTTDQPRNSAPIPELPAGRSWMETIGSHGVVVVLLLVVVAAALVTGRGSGDSDSETLAENSDLLNFDVGTEVDLPIPAHGIDSHLANATSSDESDPVNAAQPTDATDVSEALAAFDLQASPDPATEPQAEGSADPSADAIVTLDSPQPTSMEPVPTDAADPQDVVNGFPLDSAGVQFNEFVSGGTEAEFVAASNRKEGQSQTTNSFKLPTLEDLDDQPSADATANAGAAVGATGPSVTQSTVANPAVAKPTPGRVRSKTPVGIDGFLSKYLPTYDSPATAGAEAAQPSN